MTDVKKKTRAKAKKPVTPPDLKGRELWTYLELWAYTKIPKSTLYMYVAMEKIPCVRIGRHVRFIPEEVERAIRKLPA